MSAPSHKDVVRELHDDLARKYKQHGAQIEKTWRSLNKKRRSACLKAGATDGVVLKHATDTSLGEVWKVTPELNLHDISEPGSDFALDLIKHRATTSLFEQYCTGINGGQGDHQLIETMIQTKNLRHVRTFVHCYTFFTDDQNYGASFEITSHYEESLATFAPAIKAGLCVPQATGELILTRQINLLQALNILVEDILDEGSTVGNGKKAPKKSGKAAVEAFSKLSIQASERKLTLSDIVATAEMQKESFEEYLGLLSAEPIVLAHAVNICFFSRPELVPDERGRREGLGDRHTSAAVFEAMHIGVKGAAMWKYICNLLELLEATTGDKAHRAVILQEISNICHLEYTRTQAIFKRHVQSGTGQKWFKRTSGNKDNVKVTMRGKPEELTRTDAQLHYMLRLCQLDTTPSKAVDWMTKLSDLHKAHPLEREKLEEREVDSLSDLAVIIGFIQDLSSMIALPAASRKKGQSFVAGSQELEAELNKLKSQIDLRDFAVPIDNLKEPGVAQSALETLDRFIVEKTGTKMGFLYDDLVEDCLSRLQAQPEQVKAGEQSVPEWQQPASTPQTPEVRVEQRRQKEKTRPSHSSVFEITPQPETSQPEAPLSQTFRVSSSTAQVFSTLFDKSKSRGSVSWPAFESAMAELKFSVMPKFGSVYTFLPPDSMAVKKSITLHRPHQSRIEGHMVLIFARRLKRAYGWGERTFVAS
ncbi:hypothetical protein QQX98_003210 [Neonectria punicea]|uniref:Ipa protein n=1 Tax=Neonectria punicea TaxID=979145 RepID=A0ABR1HEK0_9HYPO